MSETTKTEVQEFSEILERIAVEELGMTVEVYRALVAEGESRRERMRIEEQPFIDAVRRRVIEISPAIEQAFALAFEKAGASA